MVMALDRSGTLSQPGFHPETSVWGGRNLAISRILFVTPLPRAFSLSDEGIARYSVS